ncbi:MAG: serine/threonine protein kinase [Phycisphaerae bacterium]|nr:MAG: serine/threonine protein kinase [Phycisphaerae bacterium]
MFRRCLLLVLLTSAFVPITPSARADENGIADSDWPWWRGPDRNGVAQQNQTLPATWDDDHNVLWKQPVPGRGHGSPTIVGDRVFLATADEDREVQSVLCYDRTTGEQLWKTDVHEGGFTASGDRQGHPRSTKASSTVASDGERVFINFFNRDAVYTTALSMDGEKLWQQKVSDYVMHQGYGSSPTVYGPLVIVSADNKGGGAVTAFERVTGTLAWTVKRRELPNYTSPIILEIDGRDQLIFTGHEVVTSIDPLTGALNWEAEGATVECVSSVVTDGKNIVTSGGYPSKHISVMRADGSGEVIWRNSTEVYVPSLLAHDGHIYGVSDSGDVFCHSFDSDTPLWEHRLRGKFSASPILVGDTIYATNEKGTTYIFKATPSAFELVGENTISAKDVQATAAICGNRIYLRVAQEHDDVRQEMLYCIGLDE